MVRVIEGKIIIENEPGKRKLVRVRAGVRVIEGSSYRGQNYSDAGEIDFGSS